jgi:hypothetical protein
MAIGPGKYDKAAPWRAGTKAIGVALIVIGGERRRVLVSAPRRTHAPVADARATDGRRIGPRCRRFRNRRSTDALELPRPPPPIPNSLR